MKKIPLLMIAFALFFLFFIQLAGILVESIYILDLMNTSLDAKALGLLFFFTPVLFLAFHRKMPVGSGWFLFALLFVSRGATPYLNTFGRMPPLVWALAPRFFFFHSLLYPNRKVKLSRRSVLPPRQVWLWGLVCP